MGTQQFNDIDIAELEELERRISEDEELEEVDIEALAIKKMKPICEKATQKFKESYGDKALVFEVVSPVTVPSSEYEGIDLTGLEQVEFKCFTSTQKATIVCVFHYRERGVDLYLKDEWLPRIFGSRGQSMLTWIRGNTDMPKQKQEIIKSLQAKQTDKSYEKVEGYGSW